MSIEKWLGFRIHCKCCGDPPGSEARKQAFSAAKKRQRNASLKEGLNDYIDALSPEDLENLRRECHQEPMDKTYGDDL